MSNIFHFGAIDLVNAVLIGAPMALYTGLVASRIFAFYQARYRAVLWLYHAPEFINGNFQSPHDIAWKLSHDVIPVVLELKALGHDRASLTVAQFSDELLNVTAAACGVRHENNFPDLPITAERVPLIRLELHRHLDSRTHEVAGSFSAMAPNLWPLFTPIPFPNYITFRGHVIGLLVPRLSWLRVRWLILAGKLPAEPRTLLEFAGRRSDCGNCCINCNRVM